MSICFACVVSLRVTCICNLSFLYHLVWSPVALLITTLQAVMNVLLFSPFNTPLSTFVQYQAFIQLDIWHQPVFHHSLTHCMPLPFPIHFYLYNIPNFLVQLLFLNCLDPEDGSIILLWVTDDCSTVNMASCVGRLEYSFFSLHSDGV
jgi:hypothetical protein